MSTGYLKEFSIEFSMFKKYLKKIKIPNSDCSPFCNDMYESMQHIFAT